MIQIESIILAFLVLAAEPAFASSKKQKRPAAAAKSEAVRPAAPSPQPAAKVNAGDDVYVGSSTRIDFSETAIDGKMKAPDGFFLQGRNTSSLSQMVKLRSNFKAELRNSRSAVKSHVK